MYLFLLLSVTLLLACPSAQAQQNRAFGLKAGPAISNIRDSGLNLGGGETADTDPQYLTGFSVYLYGEQAWGDRFSVVADLGFERKGFKEEFEGRDAENNPTGLFSMSTRIDYLTASVMGKVRVGSNTVAPYVLAGPSLGYLVSNDDDLLVNAFSDLTLGGVIGIGLMFANYPNVQPFIEFRYTTDFTDSLSDNERDIYNQTFVFLIGVAI